MELKSPNQCFVSVTDSVFSLVDADQILNPTMYGVERVSMSRRCYQMKDILFRIIAGFIDSINPVWFLSILLFSLLVKTCFVISADEFYAILDWMDINLNVH